MLIVATEQYLAVCEVRILFRIFGSFWTYKIISHNISYQLFHYRRRLSYSLK